VKKLNPENDHQPHDQQRREFVKKSTLLGVGVAAAAALPETASANVVSEEKPTSAEQKGYQVTQHVLDYYKSASI
jgi:hypothetical protein